jgi:hypothetical protein
MSEAHQSAAIAVTGVTAVLLAVAGWSWLAGRRSAGSRDHRFAVDRTLLILEAAVALNIAIGGLIAAGGDRPADPLHLLYAVAALLTAPVAWWWGGQTDRRRTDAWVAIGALLLLGIEARLFMTG